jgi:hypothetical protein
LVVIEVPRREDWDGLPADLGEGFRLHKDRCGRQFEAVCSLRTHPFGWELVLNVNGNLQRSDVCRSSDEILTTTEAWKNGLIERLAIANL